MAKQNNKRKNYFRELAGLRIVAMYVQEFFHWGWQQLDQQNDDGIDGYVIVRDNAGRDMGWKTGNNSSILIGRET